MRSSNAHRRLKLPWLIALVLAIGAGCSRSTTDHPTQRLARAYVRLLVQTGQTPQAKSSATDSLLSAFGYDRESFARALRRCFDDPSSLRSFLRTVLAELDSLDVPAEPVTPSISRVLKRPRPTSPVR